MIDRAGFCDVPEDEYHRDPAPEPSLSSSIAAVILDQSPRHAWWAHPRLNPNHKENHSLAFDIGKAAHKLILEGEDGMALIDPADYPNKNGNIPDGWTNAAIREARDVARSAGKFPLLPDQYADVHAMAEICKAQLVLHEDVPAGLFERNGKAEQSMFWRDGKAGIWCRARPDWIPDDHHALYNYKTTGGSAHPDAWIKAQLFGTPHTSAAFYLRGWEALTGETNVPYRFVVQENTAPYALSVIELKPGAMEMARRKINEAVELWSWCLANNSWPGYPNRICYAEAPPWIEGRWMEYEGTKKMLQGQGIDFNRAFMDWQAPITGD